MENKYLSKLTKKQREILIGKGTEKPFTGKYLDNKEKGVYKCAACGNILFSSKDKFDSGSGWPSFSDIAKKGTVKFVEDNSLGVPRTEVICAKCGGHLGHIFTGEDTPTGNRYCINSCALDFEKK